MRSLQEWMKYLEEQEQSLQEADERPAERQKPVERQTSSAETRPPAPPPPKQVSAPPDPPRERETRPEPEPWNPPRVIERPVEKRPAEARSAPKQPASRQQVAKSPAQPARRTRRRSSPRVPVVEVKAGEIAQSSYKPFRETREELLHRLLDPLISLEETARLLNVCPTTVRRYTNKGMLQHQRTAGNQRRFRLSDVLAFMESDGDTVRLGYETDQKQ